MKRARSAAAADSVLSALRLAASVHVARQGEVVVLSEGGSRFFYGLSHAYSTKSYL